MQRLFFVIILVVTLMISNNLLFSQKLITKLYDDKETIRGAGGPRVIKEIGGPELEEEFYYKNNKSNLFPKTGKCFVQYYRSPEKVTIIVNDKVTADVILAGLDDLNIDLSQDYFWEIYNSFIFRKGRLSYRKVGERKKDGMHKVVLYVDKRNLNKMLKRFLKVKYFNVKGRVPKWYRTSGNYIRSKQWESKAYHAGHPVWIHKKNAKWLPKAYTDALHGK